ncbi:EAL domain-containing protein [Arcobacter sp. CECT 8983]|uniref:EAL domain-containing protein n=1 Tax=Arcobacter sp. CECT 8983 TaxID=2044508 RepID=UPI0013E94361|nr:EAL domain-containing protein [Arcobacter sp. CECT 8983]
MNQINYKYTFLTIFFLMIFALLSLLTYSFKVSNKNDINTLSADRIKEKMFIKEKQFLSAINSYKLTLEAISHNSFFKEYINKNEKKEELQQLLIILQKALPEATQIRVLDMQGKEKIRIDKTLYGRLKEKEFFHAVAENRLQDKSKKDYYHMFRNLDSYEIGFSNIDLKTENEKIVTPKQTSLRIATIANNSKGKKSAIIIINIDIMKFFDKFKKNVLYDVMIVDKEGKFILHSDKNYGILSNTFYTFLFKDAFNKKDTSLALKEDEFSSKVFYSKKLDELNNDQDLRLVLGLKYQELAVIKQKDRDLTYLIFILLVLFLLPLIVHFSKIPDNLANKLKTQMVTDNLTNLSNKEGLLIEYKNNKDVGKIVVIIKVDNFLKVANAYGYKVANQLLKSITSFLEEYQYRDKFMELYKLDRDSFAFIYNFENIHILKQDLEKLYKDIENEEYVIKNNFRILVECTVSSSSIEPFTSISRKLQEAEIALETAHHKRSDFYIYNKNDRRAELNKNNIRLSTKVKKAIENDDILVYFQPIYNNRTGLIEKYETLVRLKYEDEIIYPDYFLPILKDIKKYKKVTKIIIQKSFEYFQYLDCEFSINLSVEDISSKEMRSYIYKKIDEYKIGNRLVIEIVESEAIENYDNFLKFIKEVKSLGCKIAIDDFGTGYSNYQYIINLNEYIDYLKIDGTLIRDIHTNRKTQLLVGTLKFLCDSLGIKTIAEYIENEAIFNYVKSMGINYSQGYYIGKPQEEVINKIEVS